MSEQFSPQLYIQILGEALGTLRKKAGLTEDGLAKMVSLNPATISRIERGKQVAGIGAVHQILDAYSIDPLYRRDELISLAKQIVHERRKNSKQKKP